MIVTKKWGKWLFILILFSLIFCSTNLPITAASKYFTFPNNSDLENSTLEDPYIYDQATIDLQGRFDEVQSNSLQLEVQQIYQKSDGTAEPVEGKSYTRELTAVEDNEFEALSVTLFEGLNKLTISGIKAGVTLSDDFYIYFDNSPYIVDLSIHTGTDDAAPLNAGAGTVVTSADAYLEGSAPNATSLVINGQYTVQPLYDGSFFSPVITLSPGRNDITIEVFGNHDNFTIERTVYYFDGQHLVFEGSMYFDYDGNGTISTDEQNNQKSVIGSNPTFAVPFSSGTDIIGGFIGKIMVPHISGSTLQASDINALIDGDNTRVTGLTVDNPTPVRYGNDHSIAYYVYDITFNVSVSISSTTSLTHLLEIETNYGGITGDDSLPFNFANNDNKIVEDVQWLYNYDSDPTAKKPLQGAQISTSTIYIEVTKNKPFGIGDVLEVYLTPYDPNNTLSVTQISTTGNTAVYRLDNIPPGSHTIVINFDDTPDVYDYLAEVDYISGATAVFMNVFDGMTIKSGERPSVIEMMIRNVGPNFDPVSSGAVFSINGTPVANAFANYTAPNQKFDIDISSNPLQFGENRLTIQLNYDGFTTTKEIFVYVSDENLPSIQIIKPVIPPQSGSRPSLSNESDRQQLYNDMDGLIFDEDEYITTAYEYDLIMEVYNFQKFQLQFDGEYIIDYDKNNGPVSSAFPTQTNASGDKDWVDNKTIDKYYDASKDMLVVRVRNLGFPAPGSQVFNLKITSSTGSQASSRFEIVREEVPYNILSPVPTTDDKIIVNKNFVKVKIQAENADEVIIDKEPAVRLPETECEDCFEMEYIGLKENRWNDIDFTVVRGEDEIDGTIEVYYARSLTPGAQYKDTLDRRMKIFDGALELEFEKGTLLQTEIMDSMTPSLYEDQQILFGIADPETGMVEYETDEGDTKSINRGLEARFANFPQNFTFISPVYWIHGGLAEKGTPGTSGYEPKLDGLPPHNKDTSLTYTYIDPTRNLVPNNRGELTLSYNEIVREVAGIEVSVFYFDKSGNWVNIGGVIDTKNHEITVPFDQFGYYVVGILRYSFPDIHDHPWAGEVLKAMYSKGFMNAARYMEFGADDYITRGEYAQLMVKALQLPLNYDDRSTFIDVQPSSRYGNYWEYSYVETAARAGIIQGIQDRIFAPNQTLTREQAAVMIARALELNLPMNDEKLDDKLRKEFIDVDQMSYYAKPAIMAVFNDDIMFGELSKSIGDSSSDSYRFNPKANLTRAEAAAIAVRVMQNELNYFPKNLK